MKSKHKIILFCLIILSVVGYIKRDSIPIIRQKILIPYREYQWNKDRIRERTQLIKKVESGDSFAIGLYSNSFLSETNPVEPYNWNEAYPLLIKAQKNGEIDPLYFFLFYQNTGDPKRGINPYYDLSKSLEALELAAQEGNEGAQNLLANLYETGYAYGLNTQPDPVKGLAWRVNSMFKGNTDISINNTHYMREDFIADNLKKYGTKDEAKARELIEKYAHLYPVNTLLKIVDYSKTDDNGQGRTTRQAKLKADAKSGDTGAMVTYSDMLMQGNYGSVDWNEAYNWLTKAHEMGSSQGTLYLHLLYIAKGKLATGLNPYYDLKKGFLYLELAAQKGNNSAQDWLASIYERGYGAEQYIPVDKAKGAAWRVLSLKSKKNEVKLIGNTYTIDEFLKSHAPFDETLKKFKPLSPEEIAKARELINEYSELYKI